MRNDRHTQSRSWIGTATIGIGGAILSRTPIGRAVTAAVVARRVWKDPRVQKVRRRVERQIAKRQSAARTAKR